MTDTLAKERDLLGLLKEQYEAEGYSFYEYPEDRLLPPELRKLHPDALAIRDGERVIVEVKPRGGSASEATLALARAIERMPNWTFRLIVADQLAADLPSPAAPDLKALQREYETAEQLALSGFNKAAFISLWSFLEALARFAAERENKDKPPARLLPKTTISYLEDEDLIAEEKARELRDLIALRNRIVHGDLEAEVEPRALNAIKAAGNEALAKLRAAP